MRPPERGARKRWCHHHPSLRTVHRSRRSKRTLCVGTALEDRRRRGRCRCRAPAVGGASRRRSGKAGVRCHEHGRARRTTHARPPAQRTRREARPRDAQSARCALAANVSVSTAPAPAPALLAAPRRVRPDARGDGWQSWPPRWDFRRRREVDAPCALPRAQSRARASSHAVLARCYLRAPLASACGHDAARNKREVQRSANNDDGVQ